MRQYLASASVAIVGASVIAATPVTPKPAPAPELRVVSADVQLAAAASLLNIPVNLVKDLVNVPYNEVQALDFASKSLFFSGPWFVVSATNLWGVDPGDPSHFRSVVNLLVPFPALSGMGLPQNDPNGLGQQLWQTAAALLPVSASCDSMSCLPNVPVSPITGIGGVDALLWYAAIATGQLQFPLIANWLRPKVLAQLLSKNGYTFGPTNYPGYADPDGKVYSLFGIPGTDGPQNLMPWHDTTFQLNPLKPFGAYLQHLMAPPADNPIQLPSLVQFGRTVQALAAATVVAFDPLTPGSPFCPGNCGFITNLHMDYPDIVRAIGNLWPGNDTINTWLTAYDNGVANVPTQAIIDRSIKDLQQPFWDFGNPSPPAGTVKGFNFSKLAPVFHALWTALGLNPPPLAPATPATTPVAPAPNTASVTAPIGGAINALASRSRVSRLGSTLASTTTSTTAKRDATKSGSPQVSGTPQGGVTPPTTGVPPLTVAETATATNPSTGTGGRSPLSGVNPLRPRSSGADTTNSGTNTTNSGTNTNTTNSDTKKTNSDTKKTHPDGSNHPSRAGASGKGGGKG